MQCSTHVQFLKGENPGNGPSKEELKLRRAQRSTAKTGNLKMMHEAVLKMPGANEWCTRTSHLKGKEVFVSQKHKPNLAFGDERESHRPDKISISRTRVQTRSARLNDSPPPVTTPYSPTPPLSPTAADEEQPQFPTHDAPQQMDWYHVTAVEETLCNPTHWHIARLPKTSAKACFALPAKTKKKCAARIVQDGKSTAAPTYSGLMETIERRDWTLESSFSTVTTLRDALKAQKKIGWSQSFPF